MTGASGRARAARGEQLFRLDSRVAVVTGGGGGIGGAICALFAEVGARVAVLDVSEEKASTTAKRIRTAGGEALALTCDVSSEQDTLAAVERVVSAFGPPTVLVNTAATLDKSGTILDIDLAEWEKVQRVNLGGTFLMSRAVLPRIIEAGGGSIVHISSHMGHFGAPGRVSYASTKAALHQFARSMARDHAASGVRVNTVSPGPVATDRVAMRFAEWSPEQRQRALARIPLGRIGEPSEIAAAVLFLASDASSFITATDLIVDGGFTFSVA